LQDGSVGPITRIYGGNLLRWRRQSAYAMPDDYIFASKTMRGKQPFWPDNLMKRHIRPIPKAIGINKRIGWHTSATPSAQCLKANGEDVNTLQELLRHANSRITLDVYTQAVNSHKHAAQSSIVKMMVPDLGTKAHERHAEMAGVIRLLCPDLLVTVGCHSF
jgi:integrase